MAFIRKLSKFISLVSSHDGRPQAVYNHRTHTLYINYEQWELNDIDYGDLPVNRFVQITTDKIYDIVEAAEELLHKKRMNKFRL